MDRIVFATTNEGKMKEVRRLLADLNCEILSLKDLNRNVDIVEDGATFEENAVIKARTVMELTNELVLADDSGLVVDFLNGAPGIYSARFMGEDTPYSIKNQAIIDKLAGVEEERRSARFICAIACAYPDGRIVTTRGVIEGRIGFKEEGQNGFGYDPIFYVPEYGCTTAQMDEEQKNEVSHRGRALRAMKQVLKENGLWRKL